MRGIEKRLDEFAAAGVQPVAISVDAPEVSRNLAQKAGYTFPIISDVNAEVIRRYDLLHVAGGPDGHDIARPAEFLVDSQGVVRWVNFTEDIRVRARADEMLAAARSQYGDLHLAQRNGFPRRDCQACPHRLHIDRKTCCIR